ncbi:PIG-L family deacetylase [Flavobacterium pallidum]|uniref:LmbE family protein n=1 Tax=Flavobacterium pallidum TaxID=2172098 RepID=A0A2S1SJW2_9FLAO|nr:PIG-L family deacetylase [Flavobacterium pallidum]AWI26659.1 LmbE family protein [Flavobacterium pallidum]
MRKISFLLLFIISVNSSIQAQQPVKPNVADIYAQIQKLNVLGTVLYIAAHPDDENTRLISYYANDKKYRTGYLSLTRGDGGQNLIGPELRELLGTIRTQELLEARKIDGGEQFFSRANDFGYSKNPDETLNIWDKSQVLSDIIWQIRKFQPDVIINRFDHRTPGTTHGHHTASAMLSFESFDLVNDPKSYPEQLQYVKPWQPKRMFFNTSWWFYGSKEKFEQADKSNMYSLQNGVYFPMLGKSNQEIAALSRSRHQSQGFGSTGTRGEETEYLEFIKGSKPENKSDIFEGIDTSWNRVEGGQPIGILLAEVEKNFDFKNPAASVPNLVKAYQMIQALNEDHWKPLKLAEIKKIIAGCTGLYLEAVTNIEETTPGSRIKVKAEVTNRSDTDMTLTSVTFLPNHNTMPQNALLKNNIPFTIEQEIEIGQQMAYTQPYWLDEKGSIGMYRVNEQLNIGKPDVIRELKAVFNININGIVIPFDKDIVYKFNDDVKGEIFRPFDIVPDVSLSILNKVAIFNTKKSKHIEVAVKAGKDNVTGNLSLNLPAGWKIIPSQTAFDLSRKGAEQIFTFEVFPPAMGSEALAKATAVIDGKSFSQEQININYDHISRQQVLKPAEARFIRLDIKTGAEKIAYIMGVGDEVPKSLTQMGYSVTVMKPEEISKERLMNFDVAMTGIRAYNVVQALSLKQDVLFDFVKEGKTMIVQYNTTDDLVTDKIAPFPLKLSRDRVTEENAPVRFLKPDADILNSPNKITAKDFEGWRQEQGLYYPNEWDKAFTPILSSNDKGEPAKNGALLVASYGKGHYIYTGLSFFRELPEGVSGAYRLMANLISVKN